MDEDDLLISKSAVLLFHIPPEQLNLGSNQKVENMNKAHPVWKGTMLFYMRESCIHVHLNDPQGNSYGQIVLEGYPGENLKPALLSSQHLAFKFQNKQGEFQLARVDFATREDICEISSVLKGYFAAQRSRKRKLEQVNTADAPPPKKLQLSKEHSISGLTSDTENECMKEDTFQCGECPAKFSSAAEIVTHWKTIHLLKKARVCLCGLPFSSRRERSTHSWNSHPNIFSCTFCRGRFLTKNELEEHCAKKHMYGGLLAPIEPQTRKQGPVECVNCGQKFVSMALLKEHFWGLHTKYLMEVRLEDELITGSNDKCISGDKECNFPSPKKDELLFHLKMSHAFGCVICGRRFATESNLESHSFITHKCDLSGKKINALVRPRFQCEFCEEKFPYLTQVQKHLNIAHPVTKTALGEEFKSMIQNPEETSGDAENECAGALEKTSSVERWILRRRRKGAQQNLEALEETNQVRTVKGNPDVTKAGERWSKDVLKNSEKSFPCTECRKILYSERGLIEHMASKHGNKAGVKSVAGIAIVRKRQKPFFEM